MSLSVQPQRAKQILWLAAPIVIAMLTQTFINVVDTVFVGKLEPSRSIPGQAALGFSLPLLWAFGGSLSALGVGTQVMTARRYGEDAIESAGRVLSNAVVVASIASIAMSIVAWFFVPYAFAFLTPHDAVVDAGVPYARVRILGIISMVLTTGYKGFFDGIGATRVHMYAAIVMNAVNIVLNYLFIFGFGPIPAMYVTGAGVASLISTFVGLGVMIAWSTRAKYRARYRPYRPSNLSPKVMWELIKLSAPSGLAQVFIMSGVLMFLKIIASLDEAAVAQTMAAAPYYEHAFGITASVQQGVRNSASLANSLILRDWGSTLLWSRPPLFTTAAKLIIDLMSIAFVTCIAFGTATATLVSQSMGRGELDEASAYGWDSVKMGMYFYGALGLIVLIFPEFFLDLLSDDAQVIAVATPGLRIMAGLQMFIAMALVLTQALFGAGATKYVMIVEFLLHGLCLAPLTYLFSVVFEWGFLGVWLSATLYITLLAAAMAWKFRGDSWQSIEV